MPNAHTNPAAPAIAQDRIAAEKRGNNEYVRFPQEKYDHSFYSLCPPLRRVANLADNAPVTPSLSRESTAAPKSPVPAATDMPLDSTATARDHDGSIRAAYGFSFRPRSVPHERPHPILPTERPFVRLLLPLLLVLGFGWQVGASEVSLSRAFPADPHNQICKCGTKCRGATCCCGHGRAKSLTPIPTGPRDRVGRMRIRASARHRAAIPGFRALLRACVQPSGPQYAPRTFTPGSGGRVPSFVASLPASASPRRTS